MPAGLRGMLDIIKSAPPAVVNALIDVRNFDRCIVVEDLANAQEIVYQRGHNVDAFCRDGMHVYKRGSSQIQVAMEKSQLTSSNINVQERMAAKRRAEEELRPIEQVH